MTFDTGALLIDVQEKLFPKIYEFEALEKGYNKLLEAFHILKVPLLVTEQVPEKLGKTLPSLQPHLSEAHLFEKSTFSAYATENIRQKIKQMDRKHWVLFGIEAHICLYQTACDLVKNGYRVTVIGNLIGSRFPIDKEIAIQDMRSKEIEIYSYEMLLFKMLHDSKHPLFKKISSLIV